MNWTWGGMLTELGYSTIQQNEIIARIVEFDRREELRIQDLYSMTSTLVQCSTLEDLNRLLDCSDLNLQLNYAPCRILILADRLYGLGIGVEYYLKKCTAHIVLGVAYDFNSVAALTKEYGVDILIIAGLQSNFENYHAVDDLRQRFSTIPVMWAALDMPVRMVCKMHNITSSFDRHKGLEMFAEYITELSLLVPHPHPETARKDPIVRLLSRFCNWKNTMNGR